MQMELAALPGHAAKDRLARRLVYQLLLEDELRRAGAPVEYVRSPVEDTPEGQFMAQVRGAVAELERAKILERMQRGKRGRAQAGNVYAGAHAPYGYRNVSEPHKGRLEILDEEAEIVRMIYRWYVERGETRRTLGAGQIAHRLSQMRILTRVDKTGNAAIKTHKDSGVWSKSTVEKMLQNETYAGAWHWNKTKWMGKTLVVGPREQWIAVLFRRSWAATHGRQHACVLGRTGLWLNGVQSTSISCKVG